MAFTFTPINPTLFDAVRAYYRQCVQDFIDEGRDLNSTAFLSEFPRIFIPNEEAEQAFDDTPIRIDPRELHHKAVLIAAAFSPEFTERTSAAARAFARDSQTKLETHFLELVSDFVCSAIQRCAGLTEEAERFDKLYERFDHDLYSGMFTLEAVAVLRGFWDNTGHFKGRNGFTLDYCFPPLNALPSAHLRDEMIPSLEFYRASCERFDAKGATMVMHYEEQLPMADGAVNNARVRAHDIIKKFVLATRLLLNTPVYSDFRGYRIPGRRSAANFLLEHFWWEMLDSNNTPQLGAQIRLEKVLECLKPLQYERFAVVDWKIEDALRRYQHEPTRGKKTTAHIALEQLLDYIQAIEAILQVNEGRKTIAEFAGLLLSTDSHLPSGTSTFKEIHDFVFDMYEFRSEVVHGRMDGVLAGRFVPTHRNKINIWRLQGIVNELAILFLANLSTGIPLRKTADQIKKNKPAPIIRI